MTEVWRTLGTLISYSPLRSHLSLLSFIFDFSTTFDFSYPRPICPNLNLPSLLLNSLAHVCSVSSPQRLRTNQNTWLRSLSLFLRANGISNCFSRFLLPTPSNHSRLDAGRITNQRCKAVSVVTWICNILYVTGKGLNLPKR